MSARRCRAKRHSSVLLSSVSLLFASACAQIIGADFDGLEPLDASAGSSGNAGSGGDAGVSGESGVAGADSGLAGSAGKGGTNGGNGGNGGTSGSNGGNAGTAGSGGASGGTSGSSGVSGTGGSAGTAIISVVINEIQGQLGQLEDYVELFNGGVVPVDLSGFKVGDLPDNETALFPPGTVIPPGGFLIVRANRTVRAGPICCLADSGCVLFTPDAAPTGSFDVPCFDATFGVGASGERIYFFDPSYGVIETIDYPMENGPAGLIDGQSLGRFPDGAGAFKAMQLTPGMPNKEL